MENRAALLAFVFQTFLDTSLEAVQKMHSHHKSGASLEAEVDAHQIAVDPLCCLSPFHCKRLGGHCGY